MEQKISLGVAGYIVDCVTSISPEHQAGVLDVDWENNTHGAASGIAASRSMGLRRVPNAMKYFIVQSS